MHEKEMVLDVLCGAKASIADYAKVITETANQNLRQTFQQMRDGDEKFQYDLYKVAEQKGYYISSPQASQHEASQIKSALSSASSMGAASAPGMR